MECTGCRRRYSGRKNEGGAWLKRKMGGLNREFEGLGDSTMHYNKCRPQERYIRRKKSIKVGNEGQRRDSVNARYKIPPRIDQGPSSLTGDPS